MEEELEQLVVGDFSGSFSSSVGEIEYWIENIIFQDVTLGNPSFVFSQDTQSITVQFTNASLIGDFDYGCQLLSWPYLSEEGAGEMVVGGFEFDMTIAAMQDASSGTLQLELLQVYAMISEFTLDLDGGLLATIINMLEDVFSDQITVAISDMITAFLMDMFSSYFDYFNVNLEEMCFDGVCMDLRAASDLYVTDTFVDVHLGGTFYYGPDPDAYVSPEAWPSMPDALNNRMFEVIYGINSFKTYFTAIDTAGYFTDTTCDAADSTDCGMDADGEGLLSAETMEDVFPEFAALFPGAAAALSASLASTPVPEILYSAIKVLFVMDMVVSAFDADAGEVTGEAAAFRVNVETVGDFDFTDYHGMAADTDLVKESWRASLEFDKYSVDAEVVSTEAESVALTEALLGWLEDAFFSTCLWGAWAHVFRDITFSVPRIDFLTFTNRSVVYDPDYAALTFNATSNWDYF